MSSLWILLNRIYFFSDDSVWEGILKAILNLKDVYIVFDNIRIYFESPASILLKDDLCFDK